MSREVTVFWFIDALGWEVVQQTDFLKDLLPFRQRVGMQFGYSSSAIPTILSGQVPAVHGHLGLFRYAPEDSPFRMFRALGPFLRPSCLWNRGRARNLLSRLLGRLYGFTGYFQLYQVPFTKLAYMDYCEKRNLFVPGGMGTVENLADLLVRSGIRYHISDWRLGDHRNLAAARAAVAKGADFLFIYTAELDAILHNTPSPQDPAVQEKLEWYRAEAVELLNTCRAQGLEMRLTVFSDHGMSPLASTVDLKAAVESTGLVFGEDYGACYDSTMLRVNFLKSGSEAAIKAALKPFEENGRWLSEAEERAYGIYRADRYFGDAIFLLNPGVQIIPSDMGLKPLRGMHGYAPEDKDSYAAILSDGEVPPEVKHVSDYFTLMKRRVETMDCPKNDDEGGWTAP
ncbi:MAG: alkaline phosphatase family protein [Victivallales bacterium]|nr:alkaline phosphatase family protein [Victivallales bacterium]